MNNLKKQETWRDIEGYEGLYQVSDFGNIKSLARESVDSNVNRNIGIIKEKILKQFSTTRMRNGELCITYPEVKLYFNKKKTGFHTHRLVAKAFISNPENKPTVNHINGIKTDNRVGNLEWSTFSENNMHAKDIGLNGGRHNTHWNAILNIEKVKEIRLKGDAGANRSELASEYNVKIALIYEILKRTTWKGI